MIFLLLYLSLISLVTITTIPSTSRPLLRIFGLLSLAIILIFSCLVFFQFCCNEYYFQHVFTFKNSNAVNFAFSFGFDGLSIFFYLLSSFLIFLCGIAVWDTKFLKETFFVLHSTALLLLIIFSALDLFFFYVAFEAILIPMFLLIGLSGSRNRKIRAAYLFFFYALAGSLLMLVGMMYIFFAVGTFSLEYLLHIDFTLEEECCIWISFFISFASKVPIFPFHIWLPEAHVEAPSVGSVMLAGIMLKLGVYAFIRFNLSILPQACLHFSPLVYSLCVFGVIYTSLSAVRQTDIKRIIAYSSVAHMNLVILGVFTLNVVGLEGSLVQSISHGFVSGGLFFLIGMLYDRFHSRLLHYFGGVIHVMPTFSALFFLFTIANISLPGTSSFVGEFLILLGIYKTSIFCSVIACTGVILCGSYSLWLYNKIFFGNLKITYVERFQDLYLKEFALVIPLLFTILIMGISPFFFLKIMHLSITSISAQTLY